jgi:hypothetical protein
MSYGQGASATIQIGYSGKKNTLVLVEVIDGWNFSLGPIKHETKPLDVTIDSHINKVIFNVISFPKNHVIIGLSWLVLHNSWMVWHMKNLHFETPQYKASKCETFIKNMENLK